MATAMTALSMRHDLLSRCDEITPQNASDEMVVDGSERYETPEFYSLCAELVPSVSLAIVKIERRHSSAYFYITA